MEDRKILQLHPLPIARAYRRYRNSSLERERERHDAAFTLFEVYLKYVASISIAHYLEVGERDPRVDEVLKGLARPSLGHWLRLLGETLTYLARREKADPPLREMAARLGKRETRGGDLLRLFHSLRTLRGAEEGETSSLVSILAELVAYRHHSLGQGARPSGAHYHRFGDLLVRGFHELCRRSPFLLDWRLVSVESHPWEEPPVIMELMGLEPVRKDGPPALFSRDETPRKHRLHLLGEDGRALSLHPLLVYEKEDVYFLNLGTDLEYLSYSTGKRTRPPELMEGIARLTGGTPAEQGEEDLTGGGDGLAPGVEAPEPERESRLGDYRLLRKAKGGDSTVFLAVEETLGRRVALKVLDDASARDPGRLKAFRESTRALARVHHPGLPAIHRVGEADGCHYCAMEWIEGFPLERVLKEVREESGGEGNSDGKAARGAANPSRIKTAVEGIALVAEALDEAHRQGVLHGRLSPSSILVEAGGRHVLVGFSLVDAAPAGGEPGDASPFPVEVLRYLAPERVARGKADSPGDIYGLGAILYEALTLKAPFGDRAGEEVEEAIRSQDPLPPQSIQPRLHGDLVTIIQTAMDKGPQNRYASPGELAADLRSFLRYEPIQARPRSRWGKLIRKLR